MKIAILGFDVEGRSSYDYFSNSGNDITICDQNEAIEVPEGVATQLGAGYLHDLDRFELLIRTPGLHPSKILAENPTVGSKISSHINEFMKVCPSRHVIGVTGTKGKGTTSTLIANILSEDGRHVSLGGNIGVPPLSFVNTLREDSVVVLELSSFQLIDLQSSPAIALCLMVVPEHLDWHSSLGEYYNSKSELFKHQGSSDIAIYNARNGQSKEIASFGLAQKIPYLEKPGAEVVDGDIVIDGQTICHTSDIRLRGTHNWQNVCAAVTAAWQISHNRDAFYKSITSFGGLEHRIELVRELDGVSYYDDSFATTPDSAIVALEAFEGPKIIVLGGSDKGADYTQLAEAVKFHDVRKVILIGQQANSIMAALERIEYRDFIQVDGSMTDIVNMARQHAKEGDVVLLSPACASFDMFKNYKDRGDQFKSAVRELS